MIEPWLKAIRDHPERPSTAQCHVLTQLALRLDWRTGTGFASERQLAADAEVTGSTVRRATRWARDHGLLKEVARGHRLGDGRTRATEWALISTGHQCAVDNDSQPVSDPFSTVHQERTSLPVPPSRPVGSSRMSVVASRRARPAVERDEDKIAIVQRAVILRGWDLAELEDDRALDIWEHFIGERKTAKPVSDPVAFFYSAKNGTGVFSTFEYLGVVLGVVPEWEWDRSA
jgi:hypothetical protein